MKTLFFAIVAVAAIAVTGCVKTVTDTRTFALEPGKDSITGRYNRSPDQVYQASLQVVANNGVLVREYITPGTNIANVVRSLEAKVNQRNVWIRVQPVDARTSQVEVQARSTWGGTDVDLSHELEKEIALQLAR